ncbi:DUF120 domain-containing protein [candidate division KSB1 bacterium]
MGGNEYQSKDKYPAKYLDVLIELAKHGLFDELKISTSQLSGKIGLSQQSASRLLKEMELNRLLKRKVFIDGQLITITANGREVLKQRHDELSTIFSAKKIKFSGELMTGLGQGGYFVGLKGYKKQFKSKLNFIPYAGTLNLKVDEKTGKAIRNISNFTLIEGFSTKKRNFGGLKCSKAKIEINGKNILGAVILPFRTVHGEDVVEVIAPDFLREKYKLVDGDIINTIV